MNDTEASVLVSRLVAYFPNVRFDIENARAYEDGLRDLGAKEAQEAIDDVVRTAHFIPPVAAIRAEAFRRRKLERDLQKPTAIRLPESGLLNQGEWARVLRGLLESGGRHQRMAAKWYEERGKRVPPDPAASLISLAQAGARGEDVGGRFRREVLGDQDEQERRHP